MPPDKLISRIKAVLGGDTGNFEIQSLALEYSEIIARLRDRLDQCVALINAGNDYAALQVAESAPPILDTAAKLAFAESAEWLAFCRERNIPWPPPLDPRAIDQVNNLYGRPINESHPLYRDYRQAIRERDELRAITILGSIIRINPDDRNARREFVRLGAKVREGHLARLEALLDAGDADAAFALADTLENLRLPNLADAPTLVRVRALRAARERDEALGALAGALDEADALRAAGEWQPAIPFIGRARSIARENALNLDAAIIARLTSLEEWAAARQEERHLALARAEEVRRAEENLRGLLRNAPNARLPREKLRDLAIALRRAAATADLLAQNPEAADGTDADAAQPAGVPDPQLAEDARRLAAAFESRLRRRTILFVLLGVLLVLAAGAGAAVQFIQSADDAERDAATARLAVLVRENRYEEASKFLAGLRDKSAWTRHAPHAAARDALVKWLRDAEARITDIEASARRIAGRDPAETPPETYQEELKNIENIRVALSGVPSDKVPALRAKIDTAAQRLEETRARLIADRVEPFLAGLAKLEARRSEISKEQDAAAKTKVAAEIRAEAAALREKAGRADFLFEAGVSERWETLRKDLDAAIAAWRTEEEADRQLAAVRDLKGYFAVIKSLPESPALKPMLAAEPDLLEPAAKVFAPEIARMWKVALSQGVTDMPFRPQATAAEADAASKLVSASNLKNIYRNEERQYPRSVLNPDKPFYTIGWADIEPPLSGVVRAAANVIIDAKGNVARKQFRKTDFGNGSISGSEIIVNPITRGLSAESSFMREIVTFSSGSGAITEPLLTVLDRIRFTPSASVFFKAYLETEVLKIIAARPDDWGFSFSPSALANAAELKKLLPGTIGPFDWIFPSDTMKERRQALADYYIRTRHRKTYEEALAWLRVFQTLGSPGFVYLGRVDSRGQIRYAPEPPSPRGIYVGVAAGGIVTAVPVGTKAATTLPFIPHSPVLTLNMWPSEAAVRTRFPADKFSAPAQGWDKFVLPQQK
ncbi:MAG: hypothetical protein LBR07_06685 [Puniceicoccales bacterium]|jgi:hypothetical protein|nr:hypothetical protein [Puniceicoccales bacterium]